MAEYITKEAAKGAINHNYPGFWAAIDALPAADVAPVAHGRWEDGNAICPVCGKDKFKDLDADVWCDWQPAYCPNCGAKMSFAITARDGMPNESSV